MTQQNNPTKVRICITKASDYDFREPRTLTTLDELLALMAEFGRELIISNDCQDKGAVEVCIYDGYVE